MHDVRSGTKKIDKLIRCAFFLLVALLIIGFSYKYVSHRRSLPPKIIHSSSSLVQVFHAPKHFSRRYGDFTANITGSIAPTVQQARYRLNEGEWMDLRQVAPRTSPPMFTIELSAEELRPGTNTLAIEATGNRRQSETTWLQFQYDRTPISLPVHADWSNTDLDVEDGYWEIFDVEGERRVRPKPGFEGYDRILVVAGAFPGGRQVETDVIFQRRIGTFSYGFGILPMWGGRPDGAGVSPRRGWSFSLTWYWERYEGVGNEFSYKYGDAPPKWVNSYRNLDLKEGRRYRIVTASGAELDASGRHLRYRQRMKWWAEGEPVPDEWIELADTAGSPIPLGEYGVALIAYRCQVNFGPVVVKPLNPPSVASSDQLTGVETARSGLKLRKRYDDSRTQ